MRGVSDETPLPCDATLESSQGFIHSALTKGMTSVGKSSWEIRPSSPFMSICATLRAATLRGDRPRRTLGSGSAYGKEHFRNKGEAALGHVRARDIE